MTHVRGIWGFLVAAMVALAAGAVVWFAVAAEPVSPHLDPDHGVLRISASWTPRGSCSQCHDLHALETGESPFPDALFAENANTLCYTAGGAGPCHASTPTNYPATETSRIPPGFPDAGYFEYNAGGAKVWGVEYRSRWPGTIVFDNPGMVSGSHYYSPHRNDPDMPRLDSQGIGSCLNCHNAHGSDNPFDMLVDPYRGIGGFDEVAAPTRYALCLNCHSSFGPPGMEPSGRYLTDYYDSSINGAAAGHQIQMDADIAISWPSHLRRGDKIPCYDCHNPHGSRGYNNLGANAYAISDERPGWNNLTDTKTDPAQSRRFCLGCHIPSDGAPGSVVFEGITMNAIPDEDGHASTDSRGCFECHGADYSSPTSRNVHNPET